MYHSYIWKLNKKALSKILWPSLMVVSFVGLLFMWISIFFTPLNIENHKIWYEIIITPFYFTHISNLMAFILSFIVTFGLIKNINIIRRFLIFTTANLIITLIVFWIFFQFLNIEYEIFDMISTLLIHLTTPVLMIFIFFWTIFEENEYKEKLSSFKESIYHLVFPTAWCLVSIFPLSFLLKASKFFFIYNFILNYETYLSIFFVILIIFFYFLVTWLLIWLTNLKIKPKK